MIFILSINRKRCIIWIAVEKPYKKRKIQIDNKAENNSELESSPENEDAEIVSETEIEVRVTVLSENSGKSEKF